MLFMTGSPCSLLMSDVVFGVPFVRNDHQHERGRRRGLGGDSAKAVEVDPALQLATILDHDRPERDVSPELSSRADLQGEQGCTNDQSISIFFLFVIAKSTPYLRFFVTNSRF